MIFRRANKKGGKGTGDKGREGGSRDKDEEEEREGIGKGEKEREEKGRKERILLTFCFR